MLRNSPFISFGFGLLSLCTAFVKTFAQAAAVRFLLGVFEAGESVQCSMAVDCDNHALTRL